jgi:hypothetical protein
MREAERACEVTDGVHVQPAAWAAWPGNQPSAVTVPAGREQPVMTSRPAGRAPRPARAPRRWRVRRGWVIIVAIAGALAAVKLTVGFTLVLVLLLA